MQYWPHKTQNENTKQKRNTRLKYYRYIKDMISNIDTDMRKEWVTDATIYDCHLREQREDTKWAIIIHRSKKNRQHNGKKKKGRTAIYKILHWFG